jgi:hypothetical protein
VVEIHLRPVTSILIDPRIVDSKLDNFTQASTFLSVIDKNSNSSTLRTLHSFPQSKNQIWSAAANVTAKDIRPDTLIMNPDDCLRPGITKLPWVAKSVNSATSNSRDEGSHVRVEEFGVMRILVQGIAKIIFREVKTFSQSREIPSIVYGAFVAHNFS